MKNEFTGEEGVAPDTEDKGTETSGTLERRGPFSRQLWEGHHGVRKGGKVV